MFSALVVSTANGVAGGWGNLGGGATQLIMPLVFGVHWCSQVYNFEDCFLFLFYFAFVVLIFGQDMPNGNFHGLKKSGEKARDKFSWVFY